MDPRNRRQFLADVGRGMLVASVGSTLAVDMGLASARAEEPSDKLSFGPLEGLVAQMQETPPERLMPLLVERIKAGTDLRTLVAAGALAKARLRPWRRARPAKPSSTCNMRSTTKPRCTA